MKLLRHLFSHSGRSKPSEGSGADSTAALTFHVVILCVGRDPGAVAAAVVATGPYSSGSDVGSVHPGELSILFDTREAADECQGHLRRAGAQTLSGSRATEGAATTFTVLLSAPAPNPEAVAKILVDSSLASPDEARLIAECGGIIDFNLDQGTAEDWAQDLRSTHECEVEVHAAPQLSDL